MKNKINPKNISSFIQGNISFYVDKVLDLPISVQEQIAYRLYTCKDTCLVSGKCKVCNCPTVKKSYSYFSCNDGKLFPNLMNKEDWDKYKQEKNITNMEEIIALFHSIKNKK